MNAYEFGDNYTLVPLGDNRFVIGVNADTSVIPKHELFAMAASFGQRLNASVFVIPYHGQFSIHDLKESDALRDYIRAEVESALKDRTP